MSFLAGLPLAGGLLSRIFDRVLPDTSKVNEAQARINESEAAGGPASILRLWRSFIGWVLGLCLAWEIVVRPIIVTYWPQTLLPPSALKEIIPLMLGMLGLS